MIPLRIRADIDPTVPPFVVRLNADWKPDASRDDAYVKAVGETTIDFGTARGALRLHDLKMGELDGDVLLVLPERKVAHRLIRAASRHNTLLVTERCDQTCVMCSQPPKSHHVDMFSYFEAAVSLAPQNCVVGISGGEPTLYKEQLFGLLERSISVRPDISFHILSNGQHFEASDVPRLRLFSPKTVQWGIPLYSHVPSLHDTLVAKAGAFERLEQSFLHLLRAGASIELRTVIMKSNVAGLKDLASHVTSRLPFISNWSLMQLERIGYARKNWQELFFDHSTQFSPIATALDTARARGMWTLLFNFPLCTIPKEYRQYAPATISDWKQRFLEECTHCSIRAECSGFFEWYDESSGFERIGRL